MSEENSGGVVRHTPDPSAYHENISGYGVTIPASTTEGGSMGFDPTAPQKVVVDPDIAGGNTVVDFSLFRKDAAEFNKAVNESGFTTQDASSAYLAAAKKISEKEEMTKIKEKEKEKLALEKKLASEKRRAHAAMAHDNGEYYDGGGSSPLPPMPRPPQPRGNAAAPTMLPLLVEQMLVGMAQQRETINDLIALQTEKAGVVDEALYAGTPKTLGNTDEVIDEEETGVTTTQIAEEEIKVKSTERLIAGFETLEMPFITGPLAMKPKKEVYFEMPNAGTMAARYHDIRDGGSCLALIYDTRYEDGIQFMPPTLGDTKIRITLPRENKTYVASSLGIHFNCGVLDVVVMFKHAEEQSEEGDLL